MRRYISMGLVVLFVLVMMVSPLYAAEKTVMKITNNDGTIVKVGDNTYPYYVYTLMSSFEGAVENLSQGQIDAQLYPNGTLGDHRATMELLRRNIVQGTTPSEGALASWYPPIQVLTAPYVYKSVAVAWELMDGPFGQALFEDMRKKTGLRVIAIGSNGGFRIFGNRVRPLRKPEDMNGLKIRTMDIPAHMELVKAMGGIPTPVAWTEVYTALQTGVVDGSELPTVGTLVQNLHEVLKYITIDGHAYSSTFLVTNDEWFSSLSPDLQDAVLMAGRIATTASRGLAVVTVDEVMEYFRQQGLDVYTLSPDQQQEWADVAQVKVIDWLRGEVGDELVDQFLAAVKEAETKIYQK